MERIYEVLANVVGALGITVSLSPGSEVPESLENQAAEIIKQLRDGQALGNRLSAAMQSWAPKLLREGETSLSLDQIEQRTPERLDAAANGDAWIEDLRNEALRLFDSAKVDPNQQELSAEAKALRSVIETCSDVAQLRAWQTEYAGQVENRFGTVDRRTSVGSELPQENRGTEAKRSGRARDIAEGAGRLFGRKGD
jgi:hypothetical protein